MVNYTWDSKAQRYVPPRTIPTLTDASPVIYSQSFIDPFDNALEIQNYEGALQIANQAILTPCASQCDKASAVNYHYLRATVLEMMHRDNEALTEYEFVAENAASPDQYQLAMLHLEPIDF